ncbi:unnamed protein product [Chironomus riparius]|uniref:Uncharacterized protein n=1 Tax=Chironomus riparius TaxID=315576 RepID=A0A9N9S0C1_9DIPT|nr:unnamed protein product [Chironomus riparius]
MFKTIVLISLVAFVFTFPFNGDVLRETRSAAGLSDFNYARNGTQNHTKPIFWSGDGRNSSGIGWKVRQRPFDLNHPFNQG